MPTSSFRGEMHLHVEFVAGGDFRSAAQWRAVVDELQEQGLIEDRSGKGELFFVSGRGNVVAEQFAENQNLQNKLG